MTFFWHSLKSFKPRKGDNSADHILRLNKAKGNNSACAMKWIIKRDKKVKMTSLWAVVSDNVSIQERDTTPLTSYYTWT